MKKKDLNLTCETDYYSARQEGELVVFSPKGNQLLVLTNLKAKEAVHNYLKLVEDNPEIRIVVLMPQLRKACREEYLSFFDMVRSSRLTESSVMRLYRAIDQLIMYILSSDVFFISADRGRILPMFASISLACDYRILGDDALFQNPAIELGLIPKGGGAWFLSRTIGRTKALELILARESISVQKARELGLMNRCIPIDNFEADVLAIARQFASFPKTSLKMAKRLVNKSSEDLSDYLEFENQELVKSMKHQKHLALY